VASVLQQLENNDAVLLMYLAGELPAEDRAEVERMLAVDAGLRQNLERLRQTYAWVAGALGRQDRAVAPAVPQAVAVRRVGRAMRQWHARRLAAAPPREQAGTSLRYPWWAYPLAAAASVVIAFLVWWGNTESPSLVRQPPSQSVPGDDYPNVADPTMVATYRGEMIARSLGLGEYGFDAPEPVNAPPEWEESGSLYAALAPSDPNVLMLLNTSETDDNDPGLDDDSTYQ